MSVSVEDD